MNSHDFLKRERRASSTKEKGGPPEDARQEVFPMQQVLDIAASGKKLARIPSENSPDKNASVWLNEKIGQSRFKVITEVINLTPAMARVLLARNPDNRKVSATVIESYARDMTNGAWSFNGEPIIVSSDGKLNDGQHRCEAVIAANVAISTVIVIGTDRASRLTVDQGKARLAGDYLAMNGHTAGMSLAAVAKYVWQHRHFGTLSHDGHMAPTKGEVLALVDGTPSLVDSLAAIPSGGSGAVGGRSVLAFCHWTFSRSCTHGEAVGIFFDALISGSGLIKKSPILYARNRLMNERGRIRVDEKAELIFRAWNASRRGDKVASLPIKGGKLPPVER